MHYRELGTTDLLVSPIGFGAFKIGRNQKIKYPTHYDLPSDSEVETLLNQILDMGINLIDTAPAYGISEERIGRLIASRRSEFVLCTKVGENFEDGVSNYDFSASACRASIERSLQRLRTDVLDIVLIHSNGDDEHILAQTDVVPVLQEFRVHGEIRAIGFSGKTPAGAELAMNWADVLMVEYNTNDTSHADIIAQANDRGVGVLVKKGLAAGYLPAEEAIRFVLGNTGVSSLVLGSLNANHLQENLRAAELARKDVNGCRH